MTEKTKKAAVFTDEKAYRLAIRRVYDKILAVFDDVDPDIVEVEEGQGTLALLCAKGKVILSTQPSVEQLWLAAASLGKALHFDFDPERGLWVDDKGLGIELFAYLREVIKESSGYELNEEAFLS